jgi:hypothetical protein
LRSFEALAFTSGRHSFCSPSTNALDGISRAEAAKCAGMDRQTLRDWVIRYNAHGVAGLSGN